MRKVSGAGRRQEALSQEPPTQGHGGRILTAARFVKAPGQDAPQEPIPGIPDLTRCLGEALRLQQSGHPVGTNATNGRRDGLVGAIPEALCGEAPEGQPRIHRRHPRQVARRPTTGGESEKRGRPDPQSSPLTKMAVKGSGEHSPDQRHGELAPIGRTWEATRKSSSRKTGREAK